MKILEEFYGVDDYEFKLVEYDSSLVDDLRDFCSKCEAQGNLNNRSLKSLKIGRWGEKEKWFVVYYQDIIVSMSGVHYFPHLGEGCYMALNRLATLNEYRHLAGPNTSWRSMQNEFGMRKMLPRQVDWCMEQGDAKSIVVTVCTPDNELDNTGMTAKVHRTAHMMWPEGGKFTLIHDSYPIYGAYQSVFHLNVRDFVSMEKINYV